VVPSADDNRYCAAERSISKEAAELDRRRHYSHVVDAAAAVTKKSEKRK